MKQFVININLPSSIKGLEGTEMKSSNGEKEIVKHLAKRKKPEKQKVTKSIQEIAGMGQI